MAFEFANYNIYLIINGYHAEANLQEDPQCKKTLIICKECNYLLTLFIYAYKNIDYIFIILAYLKTMQIKY